MGNELDLKSYLMGNFPNTKYKNISLVYLYSLDNELYKSLVAKGKIASEAVDFFNAKSKDVKQIRSSSEVLRNMGYESLIDKYLVEQEAIQQRKLEKEREAEEERLRKEEEERRAEEERIRKEEEQRKAEELEKIRKQKEKQLKKAKRMAAAIAKAVRDSKEKRIALREWEIEEQRAKAARKEKAEARREAEEARRALREAQKQELKKQREEKEKTEAEYRRKVQEEEKRKRKSIHETPAKIRKLYVKFDIGIPKLEEMESVLENSDDDARTTKMDIAVRDFVIRRSVFQCRGNGHKLRNIIALVKIFNKHFEREEISVPAGYCPICDRYFIMESTYRAIKQRGKILCRISDEKNYLNGGDDWGFDSSNMAQESILKQCGYTVAADSWMTEEMRRAILEAIIDDGVCSVGVVLNYLQTFVNLKYGQSQYDDAVQKWQSDIAYINKKYSRAPWDQYRVSGIRR